MTVQSKNHLVHIGLQANAASWKTIASSLTSLNAHDMFHPAVDHERLTSPTMAGDGLEEASRAGRTTATLPSLKVPLRGCKSGGAGDSVSSGGGTSNVVVDALLQAAFGQASTAATGETTDATDAGSGTTVTMDAASGLSAGQGILVKGTLSAKLNARMVESVASADVTIDRALLNDGAADTADESEVVYACDAYNVDFDNPDHIPLSIKHSKDNSEVHSFIGCLPASWELDFPSGADATLSLNGLDFSDYNETESAGTYSAPTEGEEVVCLDSPFFIAGAEYFAYGIKVSGDNGMQPRSADGTPRGHASFASSQKRVEVTAKIRLGSQTREYAESGLMAALREGTSLDVAFQHGRDAGAVSYCRIKAASTVSATVSSENGQDILTWVFEATRPSSGSAFTLLLG